MRGKLKIVNTRQLRMAEELLGSIFRAKVGLVIRIRYTRYFSFNFYPNEILKVVASNII